jgi:TPR repeat protein
MGVETDHENAIYWYRRAAHAGHSGARKRLQKLRELI